MADVTISQLAGQAPTSTDIFPFSTTGVTPSTYKATLAQIKTALAIPAVNNSQLAKAWVNFNGTGAVGQDQAIRSQYNITRVNKLATGQHRVYFATSMADENYVVNGMAVQFDSTGVHTGVTACWNFTASYFDLYTQTIWIPGKDNAYFYDSSLITVTVFGN